MAVIMIREPLIEISWQLMFQLSFYERPYNMSYELLIRSQALLSLGRLQIKRNQVKSNDVFTNRGKPGVFGRKTRVE